MSRTPAFGSSIESLAARRAQLRGEMRGPLHASEREEPTLAPRGRRSEADMIEVVRKFEHSYAAVTPSESTSDPEPDLAERAASAFGSDTASSVRDTLELDAELEIPASQRVEPVAIAPLESGNEGYTLPVIEPLPDVAESAPYPKQSQAQLIPRRNHRKRAILVAATAAALLIGVALGYVLGPGRDSGAVRAKIDASEQGGTQLRMDYALPQP